jgi:hypothetical protein
MRARWRRKRIHFGNLGAVAMNERCAATSPDADLVRSDIPMPNDRIGSRAALTAAIFAAVFPTILTIAPAHGTPGSDTCKPATNTGDNVCTARLTSVTANSTDGTITGTPVGGGAPITLWGQSDAYLRSEGFGNAPPDPVQSWDAAIDRVNSADPSDPDWYGQGKSRAFLPRSLDELATRFPPDVIVVRFVPDDTHSGWFRLVSIQPLAR